MASISEALACRPASSRATSCGAMKNMANTTRLMIQSTRIPKSTRRITKAVISGLEEPRVGRVQCIPHAVTQQVEGERGEEKRPAGEEDEPPGDLVVPLRIGQHVPPGRGGGNHAEAEERERRLEHDRGGGGAS